MITLCTELDENLYSCMNRFLENYPQWDRDKVIRASLSIFFLQNHKNISFEEQRICAHNYFHLVCAEPRSSSQN